jgi:hypothetical protein
MEFKTIYLIILAIFFLGIVIYDLFTRNNIMEGNENQNKNIEVAIQILNNRKQINNQNGHTDETILVMISKLSSYGEDNIINNKVSDILNSTDTPSVKVDRLSEIFDVPTYDPLNDNLVIYYNFKDIDNNVDDPNQLVIKNKSPNQYNGQSQSIFDANVILGKTNQTEIGSILDSTEPIINNSHLNLLGGNGQLVTSKNGAYLLWSNSPTFYDSNSFLGLSISVWFKSNTSTGTFSRILELTDGPGLGYIIITNNFNGNSGTMGFFILTSSGIKLTSLPNIKVVNNQWIHLVWTVSPSNGEWKIYINNECLCQEEVYGKPTNANRNICYIGKSSFDSDGLYNGKIADFRIYQREISAKDVNTLYNKGNVQDRKSVNLIKNGSFAYPKLGNDAARVVTMKDWFAGRPILVMNADHGYSVMNPTLGYATQVGLISTGSNHSTPNGSTPPGQLIQPDIKVIPNTEYEFSFLYSLYVGSSHKTNVKISVKLGCYINTNTGTDPPIMPEPAKWKKYTKTFTTQPDCTEEKLTIELISPKEGNVDTTCAITCVSLRKTTL